MSSFFFMPTRLVYGAGALRRLPDLLREFGVRHTLVVSDPIISACEFYPAVIEDLKRAGIAVRTFTGCGIDAHVAQIDPEVEGCREQQVDGVVAIGGGSVMCTAKGIAIAAPDMKSVREAEGVPASRLHPLPMFMVPTTAGSGSEVSQFTVVKDDEQRNRKFVIGGSTAFPTAAVLDPIVLEKLPPRIAAIAAVDALSHGLEALFSRLATPFTDALASEAIRLLAGCMRRSILSDDREAKSTNLLAASMANMAIGNTGVSLAHRLGSPLEDFGGLAHGLAVGVVLPHVIAFNAKAVPDRVTQLASAFGLTGGSDRAGVIEALRTLYDDIGFPRWLDPQQVDPARIDDLALAAAAGLSRGAVKANDDSVIPCPNIRPATVRDARIIYRACFQS